MIQLIYGLKGSGKTKRIIDMANESINVHHGDVIFIDDDNRYMFGLRHEIRFINAGGYGLSSPEMFYSFLCGLAAQNFDLSAIFVDAFLHFVKADVADLKKFFEMLQKLSDETKIQFVISVSADPDIMPEWMRPMVINF